MGPEKYREIEDRAIPHGMVDEVRKLEARSRIHQEIEAMKAEGKAFSLTDEEIRMLESFRRFKLRMRKHGDVFTWQTRKPDGVEIVEETGLVVHPSEGV
jgi:hypothetical protein